MKESKRTIPVIDAPITILIYSDPLELNKKLPDVRFGHDSRDFQGGAFNMDGTIFLVLLDNNELTHGIISHECKHLVNLAFQDIGFKLDADNDEIECYFLEWVVNQVYKIIDIKRIK